MRFFHLSDLHIGKQLHSYQLIEDQQYILKKITDKLFEYKPDAMLISGDIFDRSMPSGEAFELFDQFLLDITKTAVPVFIIAGNHDSPKRLAYASSFLEQHNIYISTMPPRNQKEYLKKITLTDFWGPVHFYLLPFTKPSYIRHLFPEDTVTDYDSGIEALLGREAIDYSQRNVLLSHQFYQAADWETKTCDSEQIIISVGGTDRVDAALLKDFDYAALGHLHGPQRVKFPGIRYCGSPLKYSVSEEHQKKSITLVTLEEKGTPVLIEEIPLFPLLDVKTQKGTLEEIIKRAKENPTLDYVRVILTDESEPVRPKEKLAMVFDHLLEYRIENQRTRSSMTEQELLLDQLTPLEAFGAFYEEIHKVPLTQVQKEKLGSLMTDMEEVES